MSHLFLNWTALDYVLAVVFLLSVVLSFFRGFVREAISLLSWFFAFYFALKFSPAMSGLFHTFITNPKIRYVMSAIIIFLIVLILGKIVSKLAAGVMEISLLGFFDKALGFVFGVVRGVLFITIILVIIQMTSYKNATWIQHSQVAPHFQLLVTHFVALLPKEMFSVSFLQNFIVSV